jgi:hypothetical protein
VNGHNVQGYDIQIWNKYQYITIYRGTMCWCTLPAPYQSCTSPIYCLLPPYFHKIWGGRLITHCQIWTSECCNRIARTSVLHLVDPRFKFQNGVQLSNVRYFVVFLSYFTTTTEATTTSSHITPIHNIVIIPSTETKQKSTENLLNQFHISMFHIYEC